MYETVIEQRRVCADGEANVFPGDCRIVTSPFVGNDVDGVMTTAEDELWQFEHERQMKEIMARESP